MTEDYKEQLLDYVTGDLTNTSPTTEEIFKEIVEVNRDSWRDILKNKLPANYKIEGIIKNNINNYALLYGGYQDVNMNVGGFVIIVDENFNPIKFINEFSSGTPLRYIQCMNQADDGSFYFVDDASYTYAETSSVINSQKRFVMTNNILIPINDDYEINLRTSYIIPSAYQNFYCRDMAKNPETSHYVMIGKRFLSSGNRFLATSTIELVINVGSANDWTYLTTSDSNQQEYGGAFIEFNNEDKCSYKILVEYLGNAGTYCVSKDYNATALTSTLIYNSPNYNDDGIDTRYFTNQCVFLNENEAYFVSTNQLKTWNGTAETKHIELLYHNFTTNTTTSIFDKTLGSAIYMDKELICLSKNQGQLYIFYCIVTDENTRTGKYYLQRFNGTWNPKEISPLVDQYCQILNRFFYVNNDYNIVRMFCFQTTIDLYNNWYFPIVKEIYNSNQYNGESYIDTNVLNPLYANLYSNGSIIFSRNLYNISKQNNMTMSSVEIPNNYLNDITITQNDLISETNFQMNSDDTQWTKNVYEVVDLNFLNTISIIDEETNESYLQGAIRINNAITDENDYSDMTCTKARINYTDSTTKVISVVWTPIDELHKETEITLYVDNPIMSIDFISEDEETIYLTKMLEVEQNKYYTIKQKIRIGDE